MADQGRPKQTKSGGYRGGAGEFRGMPQQPIAAKQAAAKTDYGRPRQTMADQAIVISAVLLASLMIFLDA